MFHITFINWKEHRNNNENILKHGIVLTLTMPSQIPPVNEQIYVKASQFVGSVDGEMNFIKDIVLDLTP